MSDLTDTLNPEQNLLWQEYLSAETQGVRPRTLSALSEFIEALQADSQERRDAFAETFCRLTADDGIGLSLREPLFAVIIGPYLVTAHAQEEENAGRWLAYFYPQFRNVPPNQRLFDPPDPPHPMVLLAETCRHEPDNVLAQDALIQYYARQFAYAVHEVPEGVLYGFDGATATECQRWLDDLALFREVVQKRGVAEKYEAAMRYWDVHFRGYANYLTHREQYRNYADYVSRHWSE